MNKVSLKLKSINLSSVRFHAGGIGLGIAAVIVFGTIGVPRSSIIQPFYNQQLRWRAEAPNITLHSASKDSVELKELRGEDIGLIFLMSTCQYSQDLKRKVTENNHELAVDRLFFITLGTAVENDNSRKAKKITSGFATRSSVLRDTTGEIFRAYRIKAVPSAYWISNEGVVVDFAVGYGPTFQLISRISDLQ